MSKFRSSNLKTINTLITDKNNNVRGKLISITEETGGYNYNKKMKDFEDEYECLQFNFLLVGSLGDVETHIQTGKTLNYKQKPVKPEGKGNKSPKLEYKRFVQLCLVLNILNKEDITEPKNHPLNYDKIDKFLDKLDITPIYILGQMETIQKEKSILELLIIKSIKVIEPFETNYKKMETF